MPIIPSDEGEDWWGPGGGSKGNFRWRRVQDNKSLKESAAISAASLATENCYRFSGVVYRKHKNVDQNLMRKVVIEKNNYVYFTRMNILRIFIIIVCYIIYHINTYTHTGNSIGKKRSKAEVAFFK